MFKKNVIYINRINGYFVSLSADKSYINNKAFRIF